MEKPAFLYADESWIEIEGKNHLILGAITPKDPGETTLKMVKLKESFGLSPFDEVKWNMKGLDQEQRIKLSDGIIHILTTDCSGLISIVEGEDKQQAAKVLGLQVFDFCAQQKIPAFVLYMDEEMVPKQQIFRDFLKKRLPEGPKCIGLQSLISSSEQVIQCCDIFLGLYRLVMLHELKGKRKLIQIYDEGLQDEIEWSLTEYIIIYTRYLLWGNTSLEEFEKTGFPYKRAMGLGFRLESTISEETKHLLEEKIATVYMGCMH